MTDEHMSLPEPQNDWRQSIKDYDTGFVFATSGEKYTALALQAAHSVKEQHPDIRIDIFTDQALDASVFDKVHALSGSFFRPKFEAISRSRFERTVYLDADLVVVADISDLFWILNKYDIAAAHVQGRNASWATQTWRMDLPNAFPQINSGVMAIRKNERTQQLMHRVEAAIRRDHLKMDQAAVRELLWLSDVSLYILPNEYNVRGVKSAGNVGGSKPAPRVLHDSKFHKRMQGNTPPLPEKIYGKLTLKRVRFGIKQDKQLTKSPWKANWRNFFRA